MVVAFACNEELDNEIKKMGEASNAISFDQLPGDMQKDLKDIQNDLSFMKVEVADENRLSNSEELKSLDPKTIHSINVDKEAKAIYIALKKDGANYDYIANQSKMDGEVFTVVEEMPEYPGGITNFYKYMGESINYPSQARQSGVEGRVYVQFVINKDGSVTDVKSVKGIGAGCDAEAVRIVANSENWKPGAQRGKNVSVRMVMPVIFKLEREGSSSPTGSLKSNDENAEVGFKIRKGDMLDEMIVVGYAKSLNKKMVVKSSYENGIWKGGVTDEDGNPLPGVTILESQTTSGTVSDRDGTFKLELKDTNHDVVLSFVGYETVKLAPKK